MFSPTVLKTFRRRLTNLSSRNRSLLLTSLPANQFLDLHETDFLLNKPSFSIIADLIGRKPSVALCDVLDARQERSNEVSRKLRRIDRTARFIREERGTDDLYVGWPFVRGKFLDGSVVHGPLLFFPVEIEQSGKLWKLVRRGDELAFLNPTLALAYGQFNQIRLPDDVLEKTVDDFDKDPLAFRTQLYEWLKTTPLEINFNADLFADRLQFFDKHPAKSLDLLEHTGELKLYSEAILGIFPQAGSYLVPDYDALLARSWGHGAWGLGLGAGGAGYRDEEFPDPIINSPLPAPLPLAPRPLPHALSPMPERSLHTPLPLDASQEAAVRAVKAGQSLVVQGPPGTGKSQLIANLMADAAASGKRVLLVCQKRAALDVVQTRLQEVGMGAFLALIHDFQDDRRALYAQIASQIERVEAYRQQNNGLNAVLLERDFDVESRRIDETVAELQTFKDTLFDLSAGGVSAKELYLTSNPDELIIALDDVYQQFPLTDVDSFDRRLGDYAAYQQRLGATYPWAERVSFALFTTADETVIDQTIMRWAQTRTDADRQTAGQLGEPLSLDELIEWQTSAPDLTALLTLLDGANATTFWPAVQRLRTDLSHPALTIDDGRIDQLADAWDETLEPPGPEPSLSTPDLRAFRQLLNDALDARTSWVRWIWWWLTTAGKQQLRQVVLANKLTLAQPDLLTLSTKIDKRIRLEAVRHEAGPLLAHLSLPNVGPDGLRLLRRVRQFVERANAIPVLGRLPAAAWNTPADFRATVTAVLNVVTFVGQQRTTVQTYLTERQTAQIWADDAWAGTLRQTLRRDFDLLVGADRLADGFSYAERTVVERLHQRVPTEWLSTFQNALRLTWLAHIERQHPELRDVSSLKIEQTERVLQESIGRKQALSREILLVKLREQTYRNLSFNRLNNVVTYRDLLHQTTKKRSVWPVRKLMESFADEVFKLVPCWLASPESVSAMFPLRDDLFDLVIFDEASQCFAESGIPAMARGKQIVVTGDNQQLRPSDLYRTRLDDTEPDDETPAELEVESLLELAAHQLPQLSLTEHYRSRSLDLITFSNQRFYGHKLQLLPHFNDLNDHEPAIRYINVKGTWQQNTNPVEADAVLQLIDQIRAELSGRSIGVVTFNYPQQQLIQDKLEESRADRLSVGELVADVPHLFVKNIENVQGDERDVIIFSVGYAPDERGRLAMQFGSLNASGGENRLNVAVTRARERVYVVTSLWPDQLAVDNIANEGPKLLKAYLQYALAVAQEQFRPSPPPNGDLPSGSLLKDKLTAQHPSWQPELPFADLTVKDGDTYQSLILTDDDAYYGQTPKQAHAYLPIALAARGWPFRRFWSRTYWRGMND